MPKFKFLLSIALFSLLFITADDVFAQERNTTCPTRGSGREGGRQCANEGTGLFWCGNTCRALPANPGDPRTLDCASCAWLCPGTQIDCSGTCQPPSTVSCPGGLTPDRCTGACPAVQYVLRSPATAQDASVNISQYLKSSGSLDLRTVAETPGTSGDVYLNTARAIRVDRSGNTGLNLGNYDVDAGAFHLTLRAGVDSLADLILRKGDSDRWALAVQHGPAANNFEIRRFRGGAWTTPFSLDYDNGNITLLAGATVDGVDLANVITQPAPCVPNQVLQWNGTAWTCAEQAAGGTTYGPGSNIAIDTLPTPNTIGVVSSPTFSGLTVRGGVTIDVPAGTALHVTGTSLFSGSIIASATIRGNFVSSTGAPCTADQILQRTVIGWTCAALPEAGITVEADPTFATWRGSDVGAQSLSRLTISGGLTIGANAVVSGDLRVNRNSTIDGTLSALSVTATEDVSGRDLIASRDARVTGTGTFDGAVTVNNQLTIANGGNITLDAHREIQLSAPSVGADNQLNIDGATGAGGGMALRIVSPGTANISEVLLRQGTTDRWALSARSGSSNFAIWRNNGEWTQALQIDYATGRITIPSTTLAPALTVNNIQSGTTTLGIRSGLAVEGTENSSFTRPVRIGTQALDLNRSDTGDALIEGRALYEGMHITGDYLLHLSTDTPVGPFNPPVRTNRLTVDRDGNIEADGQIRGASALIDGQIRGASALIDGQIRGASASISGASRMGSAFVDTTLNVIGNTFVSGTLSAQGSAIVTGTLTAGRITPSGGLPLTVNAALDVVGTINAGTPGYRITDARGALKMAELANEDWDGGTAGTRGWLPIYKGINLQACTTICTNHGLTCIDAIGFNFTDGTIRDSSCTATGRNLCLCGD